MNPEALVREVEAAYQSQDIDRMMELFDPEVVFYWNGRKQGEGLADVRAAHEEMLFADDIDDWEIRKTLRAASGDTIAVEWTSSWVDGDGTRREGYGGEFYTMRDGRLREWHAYHQSYARDGAADDTDGDFLDHRPRDVRDPDT
jgi:ketosteroid isomerase-like protein